MSAWRRGAGAIWLHVDCDVLDESDMPAVTYPQPQGASWDDLDALVRGIAGRPELVGVSLADFVPAKDRAASLRRGSPGSSQARCAASPS